MAQETQTGALYQHKRVRWGGRLEEAQKGGDICIPMADWRRQWHPTPVLLAGKSHGRRSLVGSSPWGR